MLTTTSANASTSLEADLLHWPGPAKELRRARMEVKRDYILRKIEPFISREGPLVRAEPHGGAHGGDRSDERYEPQRACNGANVVDELSAPVFVAAEQPRALTAESAPFGMRIGGKNSAGMVASIRRYLANSSQPQRCRFATCAVVGSSGALRGTRHGAAIDAHEAVLRINAAPTHEHEEAVGRRTTWRVHNSEKPFMLAASAVPELQLAICHMAWIGSCQHQASLLLMASDGF